VRTAALALAALALGCCLTACETSAEKSAGLEKVAKRGLKASARRRALARRSPTITHLSKLVTVLGTSVLHSSEGAAAVITLRNHSGTTLRDVPIEITVKDAAGSTIYTNATPGLAATLVSAPLLPAHATTTWVQNQIQTTTAPASVTAEVGEGEPDREAIPRLSITGVHLNQGEVEGSLVNHTQLSQHELVLYVLARRAGVVVAAGSAIVAQTEPGSSAHFQAFLIGNPNGARLEVNVGGVA
jgi:hypothetical protein